MSADKDVKSCLGHLVNFVPLNHIHCVSVRFYTTIKLMINKLISIQLAELIYYRYKTFLSNLYDVFLYDVFFSSFFRSDQSCLHVYFRLI